LAEWFQKCLASPMLFVSAAGHHSLNALSRLVRETGELQSGPVLVAADALPVPAAFGAKRELAYAIECHRQVHLQGPGSVQFDRRLAQQHQPLGMQVDYAAE